VSRPTVEAGRWVAAKKGLAKGKELPKIMGGLPLGRPRRLW
jgi:hypothetical protein